jgi:hypothetical protein
VLTKNGWKQHKPKRSDALRSPVHLKWVRTLGCGIPGCFGTPIHAHHDRSAANSGTGLKPGDENVVNLCAYHHYELHQRGKRGFQAKYGLELADHARWLSAQSPDPRVREKIKLTISKI